MTKRVLVVGPGALGIVFAVRLAEAGHEVHLATRGKPHSTTVQVLDAHGETTRDIPHVHRKNGIKGVDVLVLATKLADVEDALEKWVETVSADGAIVTLQNGILSDAIVGMAGDRLVACTVGFPATLESPGVSRQTGPGELVLGAWPDGRHEPATPLWVADVLQAVAPVRVHRNMLGVQWNKLAVNAAITGLGAMTGATLGEMMADRRARSAFIDIFTETRAAGRAEGVVFEGVSGLHVDRIAMAKPSRVRWRLRMAVLRIIGRKYRDHRSSSLQSLERGRPTEVPGLNGHIVAVAGKYGLQAPVNEAIVAEVAKIEAGTQQPSMELLTMIPVRFH